MFKPNWKIALFSLSLLPLLLMLGFWQLDREQEKIALQAEHERRLLSDPVDLASVNAEEVAFLRVRAEGRYDNERILLLDNRIHNGVVGYEVIQAFQTADDLVLVNRGWLPLGSRRDILPAIPPAEASEMRGSIHVPSGSPFLLGEAEVSAQWPRVIQSVDIPALAAALGERTVFPHIVRLEEGSPAALQPNWPVVNMEPEKHRAYAVQWFVMAAVLLLLFLYTSIHRHDDDAVEAHKVNE